MTGFCLEKKCSVGIDLGTSNSSLAFAEIGQDAINTLEITQVLGSGVVGEKRILPSVIYIPHIDEYSAESIRLPWSVEADGSYVIGAFAKDRGGLAPDRMVSSAKSWLCNHRIDRKAAILPWRSDLAKGKLSAFEASVRYLKHLRQSFEFRPNSGGVEACQVVLAVPASFDEVARSLTHEAAQAAGFGGVTLLEEPQAALYSWISEAQASWREQVAPGDIVLVCDVGGGTADFSLIAVSDRDGVLELERISVGDHILLGGDNMDLALAFSIRAKLEAQGSALDDWQFLALVHAARGAKERLLSEDDLEEVPISVASRGSSLFAKTLRTGLSKSKLLDVVLDGFLPITEVSELPKQGKSVGLQELGLPFEPDPVLSKHLARFLVSSLENARSDEKLYGYVNQGHGSEDASFLKPTAVLFNGGVFKSKVMRGRVLELLRHWNEGVEVKELEGGNFDLAVSRGAAYYAKTMLEGEGLRIRAGTARSYYLGLETSMPAVPGYEPPIKGLCVVAQGTQEGAELLLEQNEFGLVTGEPVEFRFFSSSVRAGDDVGDLVENAQQDLDETSSLRVTLPSIGEGGGDVVPVKLSAVVTEMGTLELWMNHLHSDQRWKLEFGVRAQQ